VLAYPCNLSYLGGGDWEDCSSRTVQEKMLVRPFSINTPDVLSGFCDASYVGYVGRISQSEAGPGQNLSPYLK
jgi:hypothetical protein